MVPGPFVRILVYLPSDTAATKKFGFFRDLCGDGIERAGLRIRDGR